MIPEQLRCRECREPFDAPAELEYHTRAEHSRYTCATCGQILGSEDELDAHELEMHLETQTAPANRRYSKTDSAFDSI